MGCAQSKIDNEESVARCKDRRNFMKEAVTARNAFAAGHSGFAVGLKSTGAALSDYAQGEADNPNNEEQQQQQQQIHHDNLRATTPEPPPMPPPPPPHFSPATPLQRSITMPELPVPNSARKMKNVAIAKDVVDDGESEEIDDDLVLRRRNQVAEKPFSGRTMDELPPPPPPDMKGMAWDYFFMPGPSMAEQEDIEEKDESEEREYEESEYVDGKIEENEPRTPEPENATPAAETEEEMTPATAAGKQFLHSNTAPPEFRRGGGNGAAGSSVNLLKVLGDIDDNFLKASEAAQEVSKMLEATRMHYHSNFVDNRGHIDHAARVMRVITWNQASKGLPYDGTKDDAEEYETHATVLDKLLAWEKKLYEEVKAGELIKLEYKRKVSVLNKLKKRGASAESLEKAKAAVSHLHTRYIVDMQSLDSTVSEVNDIRDNQLYPKLVALVNGMAKMWEAMCIHHDEQLKIVLELKSLEISGTHKETTKHHHERTEQFYNIVQDWKSQFDKLVTSQKQYIQALNNWLKLNLIPIESSLKEKISSPPRAQNPPIQPLLHSWHDCLETLPDEIARGAISSFAAVIKTIFDHQEEETRLKEKCMETRKEYLRKKQAFEEWFQKHGQRRMANEAEPDGGEGANPKDPSSDKQFVVESLHKRLQEEEEAYQKLCVQVRDKSLGSLKIRLPELFRAMSEYSHACFAAYERLRSMTQSQQNPNDRRIP